MDTLEVTVLDTMIITVHLAAPTRTADLAIRLSVKNVNPDTFWILNTVFPMALDLSVVLVALFLRIVRRAVKHRKRVLPVSGDSI